MNDLSKVWVKGHIYQQDAAIVYLGKTVRISFPSQPELTVTGKVVRMAPLVASSKRVIPLWIEVDNSERRLVEGMLARVEIEDSRNNASDAINRKRASGVASLMLAPKGIAEIE